jgi:hypothetical protein
MVADRRIGRDCLFAAYLAGDAIAAGAPYRAVFKFVGVATCMPDGRPAVYLGRAAGGSASLNLS